MLVLTHSYLLLLPHLIHIPLILTTQTAALVRPSLSPRSPIPNHEHVILQKAARAKEQEQPQAARQEQKKRHM